MQIDFDVLGPLGPSDKQKQFLLAKQRFVAYGGSRGGGKSWAVRKKAELLCIYHAGIKVLIMRRTYPELRENHIKPLCADIPAALAAYREIEKSINFKNGSSIKFGYCDCENDVDQYQGQEYDIIFMDEATHFTEYQFKTLTACLRGANMHPKRMYLTCNPGNVGHAWVKRLFIDQNFYEEENPDDYLFIPAKVYDNKALLETDIGYIKMLKGLPQDLRRAWLEGDWNVFKGQYFGEWRQDIHVIEPFCIPTHWRRYFTMDYGLDMLAAYCIAVDEQGKATVYKEFCKSNMIISDAAAAVKQMTAGEGIVTYFAPPDMYNRRQDTGKSVAEIFAENGIVLTKAQNERVAGWLDLKEWLKPIKTEDKVTANLRVTRNCAELIRCIPLLTFDNKNANDVSTSPHDITHAPDAIRYFVAGRPIPAQPLQKTMQTENTEWQNLFNYGG